MAWSLFGVIRLNSSESFRLEAKNTIPGAELFLERWPCCVSHETIGCPELRRPLSGSIQDQELLLDENGLRNHGADAAWTHESGQSSDGMDEEDDEIAHLLIITKPGIARG